MTEYKDTLNLPTTAFPMKASLSTREPLQLAQWQEMDVYGQIRRARAARPRFVLHDGPPYANGHLHCGHALNKILKDIIVKSKTMDGFDAAFVPGWDCHGLPIELNVEKKTGKAGVRITPHEFRAKCREYAASQVEIQREEFRRLGVFADWENPYLTMDFSFEANIIRALGRIIANGHMTQGFKPVNWCLECGSALAEAEVEYEEKTSPSIDVAFAAEDAEALLSHFDKNLALKPVIFTVWTTTPWTLPANEAVCLNPEFTYVLVDNGAQYLVMAEALQERVMARLGAPDAPVVGRCTGSALEGIHLRHPFEARTVPVITGQHVDAESGTGAVHTAPAHGTDDYVAGKAFGLPLNNPVLQNGCYAPDVPKLAGKHLREANPLVIALLREAGTLLHETSVRHSYPHCWRHKTPTIFLATPQWFVAMDKNHLREQVLTAIDTVEWIPGWGKPRITNMVENRPDWCISRQRAWGTPIPLFLHKVTREPHPQTSELIEAVARRVETSGIDAWFSLEPEALLTPEDVLEYDKCTDTLDVWFDSGVSHFTVLRHNLDCSFPADLYLEGSDQHRGWFNSSLTTSVAMDGVAPYRTVMTHGYTVDKDGRKLSKSAGNYVALDKVIAQYGADILRLWVSSADYRQEVSISEEILTRVSDAYRRIRNTARFLLANLFDFNPETHSVADSELVELDRWIILSTQALQEDVKALYASYQFHAIYQKIHNFCAEELGSFYLDIIKDRQYTTPADSLARRSCQTAMYHIIQSLVRMIAPILSFTAEEIWKEIPGNKDASVFLETWYTAWPDCGIVDMDAWERVRLVRDVVYRELESKRREGVIGSGLEAEVCVGVPADSFKALARLNDELRFVFITSMATLECLPENSPVTVTVTATEHPKCERCWHRRADVGTNASHPTLCGRCVGNVTGVDEVRQFA
ncbi:isoleucyl-tRNA synthetase [Legionella geestiana]|uniref:Isoleucine--tRNA ligase n=1 Tax=Legionella geestiana TaxID=45065 RepID=A0A0W0TVI5_9GAMM|nr:isoleucine--tRNA ligase [Legionella geestiana]KTC99677.1 isoleucyl-tRNA synthetase [Legionella geestiana]QBS13200.1 isoleucine--tRNA ligase [Legionella geestiana]STX54278.1 isoleucyl-tRNA synthetase [Legionella geestiana]